MKKIFALVLAIAGLPGTMRGQQGYRPDTRTPDEVRRAMAATPPADRLAAELQEIQAHTLAILRKADFAGDYYAALQAAWTARANTELRAALSGQLVAPERAGLRRAPTIYLIAFKEDQIRAALAYWVENGTLYYVTRQGKREQAPLDSLDREFSEQLNRERGLEFRLPAP